MDDRQTAITRNTELIWRINEELLRDPNHPYAGRWIGIANGLVGCAVFQFWIYCVEQP